MSIDLIEHNPLLKQSLLNILSICKQHPNTERSEFETLAAPALEGQALPHSVTTIVDVLLRNDALEEKVLVNGVVYDGTLHDVQTDANISDDAQVERYLSITETGEELLTEYAPHKKLNELLAEKPHHAPVYYAMLEACNRDSGRDRSTLENTIDALPQLAPNPATGEKTIYPQYFIDSLETAGGIAWQDQWHTTEAGRAVMSAS